ncbi:uncharacterized protein LOC106672027 isoform X1 [Cimex lectularius]|uniref:Uncharacterized protein n=1 Tax=Cimex lectularius TaxID=79782 RepID=A0A8I6TK06_CIMLE|nr:uncharacterized protein LOC106672027 isoform X1 [Cimex lectularius]
MNPNSEWDDENDETIVFDSDAAKESIKNIKCTFIKLVLNQISRLKKSVNENMFLGKAFIYENNEINDEFVPNNIEPREEKNKNNQPELPGKSDEKNQTDQPPEKKEDLPFNVKVLSEASLKLGASLSNKSNNELKRRTTMSIIPPFRIEQQIEQSTRAVPPQLIDCSFSKSILTTIVLFFATLIVLSAGAFLALKFCDCFDKGYAHSIPNKFVPY